MRHRVICMLLLFFGLCMTPVHGQRAATGEGSWRSAPARAYLQVGNKQVAGGFIKQAELALLDSLIIRYDHPEGPELTVLQYELILVDEQGDYLFFDIQGARIPASCRAQMQAMKDPIKLFIQPLRWRALQCFEQVASLVLDIR